MTAISPARELRHVSPPSPATRHRRGDRELSHRRLIVLSATFFTVMPGGRPHTRQKPWQALGRGSKHHCCRRRGPRTPTMTTPTSPWRDRAASRHLPSIRVGDFLAGLDGIAAVRARAAVELRGEATLPVLHKAKPRSAVARYKKPSEDHAESGREGERCEGGLSVNQVGSDGCQGHVVRGVLEDQWPDPPPAQVGGTRCRDAAKTAHDTRPRLHRSGLDGSVR